jgi:hypothetical protein
MAISVTALHQSFVGEVSGVDLCSPVKVDFVEISEALDRHAVLVFTDQQLTDEQQIAFSRLFGSLETSIGTIRKDRKHRLQSQRPGRYFQPGRKQQYPIDVRPLAHDDVGKSALAYRQFVQAGTRQDIPSVSA